MSNASARIDWVDYAKGICIIMVVMMHSTLGVEKYAGTVGWMGAVVEFAKPFRMPDFFLISGLFLARVIDRPWPDYLDRKVVHFVYFYLLWVTIQCVVKCGFLAESVLDIPVHFLTALIQPFGTLWFIYLLPIFFVLCKLLVRVPVWAMFTMAAVMHMAPVHTGWTIIDEFASRFVFFYAGYAFAPWIFQLADFARKNMSLSLGLIGVWAVVNGGFVVAGLAGYQPISLFLGFAGAFAIVSAASMLATIGRGDGIRYCGANSIVIYLAFFFPMIVTRTVLLKLGIIPDVGTISLIVTVVSVIAPLIAYWIVRGTWAGFLFKRPAWAYTYPRRRTVMQPAE